MRKITKIGLWSAAVLAIAAGVATAVLVANGGNVFTKAVNQFGPGLLGVAVTLDDASLRPLRGEANLTGLHVGNPEGFRTTSMFEAANVAVQLDVLSLFSNTIHIRRVEIISPRITYERRSDASNIWTLEDQLAGESEPAPGATSAGAPAPATPPAGGHSAERRVIIDELVVTDPQLNASFTMLDGRSVPVALGKISVKDIGKDNGGLTFKEVVRMIVRAIAANVEKAVAAVVDVAQDVAREVERRAAPVVDAVKDTVGNTVKDVMGRIRK